MPLYPYPPETDIKRQSADAPSPAKAGESRIFKSAIWERSVLTAPGQPRTLYELFEKTVAKYPQRDCFAYRAVITPPTLTSPAVLSPNLTGITYTTVQSRRNAVGSSLLALERSGRLTSPHLPASRPSPVEITFPNIPHYGSSNRVKGGSRRGWGVGLWSKNRVEWQLVDLACHAYGLIGVSLYETLGPDVASYITNHCPLSIIFAEPSKIPSLLKMAPKCPSLRVIVSIDPIPPAELAVLTQWASSVNLELLMFNDLEAWGSTPEVQCPPGPVRGEEDLDINRIVTISYTSGTTGDPKGVVLTNANVTTAVISNAHGSTASVTDVEGLREWRYISILPLSHIYARFLEIVTFYGYGTVCYTSGDPLRLVEDAQIIKPDLVAAVPRIYNKIYGAVMAQMNAGGLKGALLTRAINAKLYYLKEAGTVQHKLWDALVFRKIRALLGGQVKYMSSGAAPLSAEVQNLIRICFSCDVVQGCGMTETIGTMSKGIPWDMSAAGTCGQIQPCNDIKLVDVPEMGYMSKDTPNPRGEICVKGSNVTPGYLHDPINTAKTIDKDGWLHTGDIGEIDQVGRLKIIDRMKNVVKLSQGEYVALEKVEGIYTLDPLFASMMVHADPTQSHIVALAVLDPLHAIELVSRVLGKKVSPSEMGELEAAVKDPKIKRVVLQGFKKAAAQHGLAGFETIKGVYLTLQPFPEAFITPTMKLKRNQVAKHFKAQIDEMYAGGATEADGSMLAKL